MAKESKSKSLKHPWGNDSPSKFHAKAVAGLKTGEQSSVMRAIVNQLELTPEHTQLLAEERLRVWKQLDTPSLFLANQFVDVKTLIDAKLLSGLQPGSKEYIELMKLLLEFNKEYNRLTQVSADKKAEAFARSFSRSDDVVIDISEKKDDKD